MQASRLSLIVNAAWVVKGELKPLSKLRLFDVKKMFIRHNCYVTLQSDVIWSGWMDTLPASSRNDFTPLCWF